MPHGFFIKGTHQYLLFPIIVNRATTFHKSPFPAILVLCIPKVRLYRRFISQLINNKRIFASLNRIKSNVSLHVQNFIVNSCLPCSFQVNIFEGS